MMAQCTMANCGELISSPLALDLADSQIKYNALTAALVAHLLQRHPEVFAAVNQATANFAAALASKLFNSADPQYHTEQQSSFRLSYWLLMGTLTTDRTAGQIQTATFDKADRPAIVFREP